MRGKKVEQIKGSRDARWGVCFAVLSRVFMMGLVEVILVQRIGS